MRSVVGVMTGLLLVLAVAACGSEGTEPGAGAPDTTAPLDDRDSDSFIGLTVEAAAERAEAQERVWRVVREDGVDLIITMDFLADRLNFSVEDGVVVDAVTDEEMASDEDGSASYVGLTIEDASARADGEGRPWRIVHQDGEDLAVTDDYSPDRLNFSVEDGIVIAAVTDAEMVES